MAGRIAQYAAFADESNTASQGGIITTIVHLMAPVVIFVVGFLATTLSQYLGKILAWVPPFLFAHITSLTLGKSAPFFKFNVPGWFTPETARWIPPFLFFHLASITIGKLVPLFRFNVANWFRLLWVYIVPVLTVAVFLVAAVINQLPPLLPIRIAQLITSFIQYPVMYSMIIIVIGWITTFVAGKLDKESWFYKNRTKFTIYVQVAVAAILFIVHLMSGAGEGGGVYQYGGRQQSSAVTSSIYYDPFA